MKNRFFVNFMYFMALTLVMGIGVVIADNVGTLTTFQSGTVAKSAEVNDNFSTIANSVNDNYARLPMMWAQTDVELADTSFANAVGSTINSLTINAPSSGFIVISGSVVLYNNGASTWEHYLIPYVDGVAVPEQTASGGAPNDFASTYKAASSINPGAIFPLSYTLTIPITAGIHTVSQTAGPQVGFPAPHGYNKNYLTVVFYPDAQGTMTEATDNPI